MIKNVLRKISGDPSEKEIRRLLPVVEDINQQEKGVMAWPDEAFSQRTRAFQQALQEVTQPHREKIAELQATLAAETESFYRTKLSEEIEAEENALQDAEDAYLDEILPEAFAMVREASRRTIGLRHFDVQLLGGIILHHGNILEMKTGEGKTLVSTLPLYLNALTGRGVHLVTVNDYLTRRDGGWMGPIFDLLGLGVGVIGPQFSAVYDREYVDPGSHQADERLVHWRPSDRAESYQADITYGTSSEFGFDYLRDHTVYEPRHLVQRGHHFAIIDEVDNVLIDEARTPLIISGLGDQPDTENYERFARVVRKLEPSSGGPDEEEPDGDFVVDIKQRSIWLTDRGIEKVERMVGLSEDESIYDPQYSNLTAYLDNALKAQYLFERDHDYVVVNREVLLVDEFTGRIMPGRRYSEGLHQAIEAKEGVPIQSENITIATVSIQNYFRMYEKLSGMTGTAKTEEEEFQKVYDDDVFVLPTNVEFRAQRGELIERKKKQSGVERITYEDPDNPDVHYFKRVDYPDYIYGKHDIKFRAVVNEIRQQHDTGRPILVGTTSIEASEELSALLKKARVEHNILNAKHHEKEAIIITQAGRKNAVTIATNMAGRGTDIILGGNVSSLAAEWLQDQLFNEALLVRLAEQLFKGSAQQLQQFLAKYKKELSPLLVERLQVVDQELAQLANGDTIALTVHEIATRYRLPDTVLRQALYLSQSQAEKAAFDLLAPAIPADMEATASAILRETERYLGHLQARVTAYQKNRVEAVANEVYQANYVKRQQLLNFVLSDKLAAAQEVVASEPLFAEKLIDGIMRLRQKQQQEHEEVVALGGLFVLGTERHESRRIDNQLRGRSGRQGDPGESRFFVSLDDDLMRRFGGSGISSLMERFGMDEETPLSAGAVTKAIDNAQTKVEGYNFDIRKHLLEYDDVVNRQRQAIYKRRQTILRSGMENLEGQINDLFDGEIDRLTDQYLVNFSGWVGGEINRLLQDYVNPATDQVSMHIVRPQLGVYLPALLEMPAEEIPTNERAFRELLAELIEDAEAALVPWKLFSGALFQIMPILPPVVAMNGILRPDRPLPLADSVQQLFHELWAHIQAPFELDPDWLAQHPEAADWVRTEVQRAQVAARSHTPKAMEAGFRILDSAMAYVTGSALAEIGVEATNEGAKQAVQHAFAQAAEDIPEEHRREFSRWFLLRSLDNEWQQYLTAVDELREGIGLRAMGQSDPLVEFKRASFEMYNEMLDNIDQRVVEGYFLYLPQHSRWMEQEQQRVQQIVHLAKEQATVDQRSGSIHKQARLGRNDPCWCGSGKKYKDCHMLSDLGLAPPPAMTPAVVGVGTKREKSDRPAKQPAAKRSRRSNRRKRKKR